MNALCIKIESQHFQKPNDYNRSTVNGILVTVSRLSLKLNKRVKFSVFVVQKCACPLHEQQRHVISTNLKLI